MINEAIQHSYAEESKLVFGLQTEKKSLRSLNLYYDGRPEHTVVHSQYLKRHSSKDQ